MKTRIQLLLLALLGLVLTPAAQAYYNSSTGRWLNRDCLNEQGSRLAQRLSERPQRSEEMNLFRFVRNNPMVGSDAVGLKTKAERAGACQDPCKEYAAAQLEENEGWMLDGAPICCGGKLYYCSWGQDRVKNARAKQIAKKCSDQHERTHGKGQLEDCPPCNWQATKPNFRPEVDFRDAECAAHKRELACLNKAECHGDADCEVELERLRKAEESAVDSFCKAGSGPPRKSSR